jgi:hypothetical protein
MDHFGMSKRSVYKHINTYRDRNPLPDDYVTKLRNRAKSIGAKALDVIEDNLSSDKPDMHTAIQTAKGTGAFVEKQEIETSLVVHDSISPEDRFKQISQAVLGRNPDIESKKPDCNIPPSQIAQSETDTKPKQEGIDGKEADEEDA